MTKIFLKNIKFNSNKVYHLNQVLNVHTMLLTLLFGTVAMARENAVDKLRGKHHK